MRMTVRVPATSANLGPGFDSFGLALELCNEVEVDTDGAPAIAWRGEGAEELPTDGSDLFHETVRRVSGGRRIPPFGMRATNRIPLARGLGSSSSAVVAGAAVALALLGEDPSPRRVFDLAAPIEGHPDNVAPACFGGFTIATPDGLVRRLDPDPGLRPVVLVPQELRLPTDRARAALPDAVPRSDAVFNLAHAALVADALVREPSLLGDALRDRLHQDARLELVPSVRQVFDALAAAGVPVCVSGAGPALLTFPGVDHPAPEPADGWRVLPLEVRAAGFELVAG
jgi:homoserine kinase